MLPPYSKALIFSLIFTIFCNVLNCLWHVVKPGTFSKRYAFSICWQVCLTWIGLKNTQVLHKTCVQPDLQEGLCGRGQAPSTAGIGKAARNQRRELNLCLKDSQAAAGPALGRWGYKGEVKKDGICENQPACVTANMQMCAGHTPDRNKTSKLMCHYPSYSVNHCKNTFIINKLF